MPNVKLTRNIIDQICAFETPTKHRLVVNGHEIFFCTNLYTGIKVVGTGGTFIYNEGDIMNVRVYELTNFGEENEKA